MTASVGLSEIFFGVWSYFTLFALTHSHGFGPM